MKTIEVVAAIIHEGDRVLATQRGMARWNCLNISRLDGFDVMS
jgi:hypothetical protein